jgi:hypothetical protein
MKKLVYICVLVVTCSTACRTQPARSKHTIQIFPTSNKALLGVKGPNYKGTIFTEKYPFQNLVIFDIDSTQRFTPSIEEIEIVEGLLRRQLKAVNKRRPNQQSGKPVLHRNLPKYFRQYIGFINKKGDKTIHVNFHWNRYNIIDRINNCIYFNDSRINYESNYSVVLGGGSHYWQINANIAKRELTDLLVNGFDY